MSQNITAGGRSELMYDDRQALTEGEKATLVYKNSRTGTTVEKSVTVVDTSGSVTVTTERGTEWGIFGGGVRTSVDTRRASGTVAPKNGRRLGSLVSLKQ